MKSREEIRVAMSTLCRLGHAGEHKNGFQAAIPETLRSAARVQISGGTRAYQVRANPKNQPLQGLDTTDDLVEQKNLFCRKNHSYKLWPLKAFIQTFRLNRTGL